VVGCGEGEIGGKRECATWGWRRKGEHRREWGRTQTRGGAWGSKGEPEDSLFMSNKNNRFDKCKCPVVGTLLYSTCVNRRPNAKSQKERSMTEKKRNKDNSHTKMPGEKETNRNLKRSNKLCIMLRQYLPPPAAARRS
jgi:hypothetical protein